MLPKSSFSLCASLFSERQLSLAGMGTASRFCRCCRGGRDQMHRSIEIAAYRPGHARATKNSLTADHEMLTARHCRAREDFHGDETKSGRANATVLREDASECCRNGERSAGIRSSATHSRSG